MESPMKIQHCQEKFIWLCYQTFPQTAKQEICVSSQQTCACGNDTKVYQTVVHPTIRRRSLLLVVGWSKCPWLTVAHGFYLQ